jgi:hypothetical protein
MTRVRHLSGIPHGYDIDSMSAQLIAHPSDYLYAAFTLPGGLLLNYGAAEPVLETRRGRCAGYRPGVRL